MNDVAPRQETLPGTEVANPFTAYGEEADRSGSPMLRFNQGNWTCGQNNTEVSPGTKVLVDIAEIEIGWRKWWSQAIVDTVSGKLAEGYQPPKRDALGDHDQGSWEMGLDGRTPADPWEFFNAMPVYFVPGEEPIETSATVLLVGNSKGFLGAIGRLSKAFGERMRLHPDELPVCELDEETYHNQTFKKDISTPVFRIVGWSTLEAWSGSEEPSSAEPPPAAQAAALGDAPGPRRNF